jgi:hypothetical protein
VADRLVEHLKFETEVLKLTTLAALAIGGGTVGLILGPRTPLRVLFAGIGLLLTVTAAISVWRQQRSIRTRIAGMKEDSL